MTLVALVAILFTGRYPRAIFDFNVGVLRWTWRVVYYACALGTDRYPPFTLAPADYPAELDVPYPAHLSRGKAFFKPWLLLLPHWLVVATFLGWWDQAPGLLPVVALHRRASCCCSPAATRGTSSAWSWASPAGSRASASTRR